VNETYPRSDESAEEIPALRNPWGWVVLAVLFSWMIFSANLGGASASPAARAARYSAQLKAAMASYEAGDGPFQKILANESPDAPLRKLERETAARHLEDPIEASVWTTVRKQLGEPVTAADLKPLQNDPIYRPLAEAFRPGGHPKAEAQRIVAALEARRPPARVTANIVRREAGLPVRKIAPPKGNRAVVVFGGLLILASGAAWVMAAIFGLSGMLRPQGPATEVATEAKADQLALGAATLLATFLGFQLVAALLVNLGLNGRVGSALVFAGMLVAVPVVLRRGPGLKAVGLGGRTFARDVGLGFWAFLLELPVTGAMALLAGVLLRGLPTPTHPATTALESSPDLLTILVTLFSGAIVAPFWEETMFRGLLFPALRKVLKGPIPAALLSSLLFASIHPQGPVLWAALATVALFSCALAQTTRSLVPSITMHVAHNTTILVLSLLVGR